MTIEKNICIVFAGDVEQEVIRLGEQLEAQLRIRHDINVSVFPTYVDVETNYERYMTSLRTADIMLVLVSHSLFKCEWCMEEIEYFLDKENRGEPVNIIPVPLEPVPEIYTEIRSQTTSGEPDDRQARVAYALEKIGILGFSAPFPERYFAQRENYLADMIARSIKEIKQSDEFDHIYEKHHLNKIDKYELQIEELRQSQPYFSVRGNHENSPSSDIGLLSDEQLAEQRQLFGSALTDTLSKDYPKAELVDFSVFSPLDVTFDQWFGIQVYLHLDEQVDQAVRAAISADQDARLRKTETLHCHINRGSKLNICIICEGLDICDESKSLVWRGRPTSCTFEARIPAEQAHRTIHPKILIFHRSQLLGEIIFSIRTYRINVTPEPVMTGESTTHFERIFMSYARKDMSYVRQIARTFISLDRDFFWDMLHIGPKERWEKQLYKEIDKADLFYLFWSCSARDSKWVRKETEYALERAEKTGRPEIICYPLEGPPRPAPLWEIIRDQQCGDMIYNLMAKARPRRKWLGRLFRNGKNG